jgi:hypothetical protein
VLTLTDRARDALVAADAAARRFNPDARVRLRRTGAKLVADLTDAPGVDESLLDVGDITIVIETGLHGTIDAGEHNAFVFAP